MENLNHEQILSYLSFLQKLCDILPKLGLSRRRIQTPSSSDEARKALDERPAALVRARTDYLVKKVQSGDLAVDEQGNIILPEKVLEDIESLYLPLEDMGIENQPELHPALLDMIAEKQISDENVRRILVKSIHHAPTNKKVTEQPVDPDWTSRWHHWARDVSNQEVQDYWARILADEVKQPGSFSFHTLDLLSRMSAADVRLVDQVCKLRINDFIYRDSGRQDDSFLRQFGLTYEDILTLGELGVINRTFQLNATFTIEANSKNWLFRSHDKFVGIVSGVEIDELSIPCYRLTRAGKELCSLGFGIKANSVYIRKFAESLKRDNLAVYIGDTSHMDGDSDIVESVNPTQV